MIGARLRELRRAARMTQTEMAAAAGVSAQTVSRIERGEFEPSLSTLRAFAGALDADVGIFLREGEAEAKRTKETLPDDARRLALRLRSLPPRLRRLLVELVECIATTRGRRGG